MNIKRAASLEARTILKTFGKIRMRILCHGLVVVWRLLRWAGFVAPQPLHTALIRSGSRVCRGLGLPGPSRWAGFVAWKTLYARPAGTVAGRGLCNRRRCGNYDSKSD